MAFLFNHTVVLAPGSWRSHCLACCMHYVCIGIHRFRIGLWSSLNFFRRLLCVRGWWLNWCYFGISWFVFDPLFYADFLILCSFYFWRICSPGDPVHLLVFGPVFGLFLFITDFIFSAPMDGPFYWAGIWFVWVGPHSFTLFFWAALIPLWSSLLLVLFPSSLRFSWERKNMLLAILCRKISR